MFTFENTVLIDRPVEDVFAFAADLPSPPKWNYFVRSVSPTSPQVGAALGAVFVLDEKWQ
jgi:uncharacterized membrane protein